MHEDTAVLASAVHTVICEAYLAGAARVTDLRQAIGLRDQMLERHRADLAKAEAELLTRRQQIDELETQLGVCRRAGKPPGAG